MTEDERKAYQELIWRLSDAEGALDKLRAELEAARGPHRSVEDAVAEERRHGNAHLEGERKRHAREMVEQRERLMRGNEKQRAIVAKLVELLPASSTRKTIPAAELRDLIYSPEGAHQ